jgi:glycosyltransferase involved in cell wall biosynthesis
MRVENAGTAAIATSIVLPVYRQALELPEIVERAHAALARVPGGGEILLVANGDGDDTRSAAAALAAADPTVRLITSSKGWGAAVIAGLAAAQGELLCYTNSARTQSRDLELALHYGAVNTEAVVKASRKQRSQAIRRAGSVLYNFEARALFGLAVWDVNGTPKVFHRSLLDRLELTEQGDLIDLELCALCKIHNIPVVEVPVYDTTRINGRATTNMRSALRLYAKPFAMRRRLSPARNLRTADASS